VTAKGSGQFWYTDDKGRPRQTQAGRLKKAKVVKDRRDAYLKGKICALCDQPAVLVSWLPEYRPQPYAASIIWTYSDRRREDYLEFTRVLCQEHHNKSKGRTSEIEHGGGMRGKPGCDCIPCVTRRKAYGTEQSRRLRARRKALKQLAEERKQGK
jgi:hypothetical protein